MSYEVVDKDVESNDVFTGGADGHYAKNKTPTADTTDKKIEKKKKASKVEAEVKHKKKRAPKIEAERENIDPAISTTEVSPPAEESVKKKKAKAPRPAPVT